MKAVGLHKRLGTERAINPGHDVCVFANRGAFSTSVVPEIAGYLGEVRADRIVFTRVVT